MKDKRFIFLVILFCQINSTCITDLQKKNNGIVQLKTVFYKTDGTLDYTDVKRVWYKDSSTIEQVTVINFVTDTSHITTINSSVIFYRFINLKNRTLYDFMHFSDTSIAINKGVLPDTMMMDYGWSYYSDKVRQIKGTAQDLNDTMINNIKYKRIKFNFLGDDLEKVYKVGYFRCDGKGKLFSLEKSYGEKLNCVMTKFEDFQYDQPAPRISMEIEFPSDTLTKKETDIFEAWEKYTKEHPVKK